MEKTKGNGIPFSVPESEVELFWISYIGTNQHEYCLMRVCECFSQTDILSKRHWQNLSVKTGSIGSRFQCNAL